MNDLSKTREAWLHKAAAIFRPRFEGIGMPLPEKLHLSVGFGPDGHGGENAMIRGVCISKAGSEDGVNHVYISPELGDTAVVLAVLLHELIHAADDCQSGHRGAFAEGATRLGLMSPMTTATPSIELAAELMTIAETLGDYPHGKVLISRDRRRKLVDPSGQPMPPQSEGPLSSGPKKQSARLLKAACNQADCVAKGYTVRVTAKWLAIGAPMCPMGHPMEAEPAA
ncbi:hypothetical protein [Nonomuraea sp. CA-141351]|uniref:hypothetical protein n=1 Tax=Nonomuraea sp. CA-141351 TaxID=3239996 RepID=UPI003D8C124A